MVPALSTLKNRDWYFPSWLEWIPNVSIERHLDDQTATEKETVSV
jgi:hypothetical protein